MNNAKFVNTIVKLLGEMIIHHEYGTDTLTVLVKNVNAKVEGRDLMEYIKEKMKAESFKDISFSFGDGHWMTIHNKKTIGILNNTSVGSGKR